MELEEEHLQDQITGAIDRNQPNKSAKTWNPQESKNNNGGNLRIAIPAHLSESCGTSGGDHAPNGEREKRESEWSDREIRRRGSKQLETVDTNIWGSPCVQPRPDKPPPNRSHEQKPANANIGRCRNRVPAAGESLEYSLAFPINLWYFLINICHLRIELFKKI